jgi:hypothetical protein
MKANATGTGFTQTSGSQYVFSQRTNFVDINNDGHLDAFVCHDVAPNVYYINDGFGNLSFNQGGLGDHPEGGNYGSIWVDYDNDGYLDLFIAKCRGGVGSVNENELHRNNGDGTFTDVSVLSNMNHSVQTWSAAWNDFDNDGFMDAVIGVNSFVDGGHVFMRNNGDGTFEDVTIGSGWDTFLQSSDEFISYDFNNDGFADVLTDFNIFYNNGDNTFNRVQVPFRVGAVGDLNNDGFLDIMNDNTAFFNNGNDFNWLKLNLKGTESNPNGIGARIEVYSSLGKQIRDVQSGIGFSYASSLNTHFGLGNDEIVDSVVVKWPSGRVEKLCEVNVNSTLFIEEGSATFPIAGFTVINSIVLPGDHVSLIDTSLYCPNLWDWTIEPSTGWETINNTTLSSQQPQIVFNELGIYTLTLQVANNNGLSENEFSQEIVVTDVLNVLTNKIEFSIFPNPSAETIYIYDAPLNSTIRIVDFYGNMLKEKIIRNKKETIDVQNYANGMYLVQIVTPNKIIVKPVVVSK